MQELASSQILNRLKVKEFLPFVIPVTTTSIGRISGPLPCPTWPPQHLEHKTRPHTKSSFQSFVTLPQSQVAQSFVPAVFEAKEKSVYVHGIAENWL
mmetsp:Transcript_7189/g.12894  ORF Transcript_7189/g.12894 Transcript_7189/m.12894 type:complete len:97 (-) Transcript_7189:817-1107(-)